MYLPDVSNMDDLSTMLDNELVQRWRALDEDRQRALEQGVSPQPWEVEIAYVRREQQIRRERREAHAEITRREQEEFYNDEAGLPPGDMDNFAFVYAATGGRPRWN